MSSSDNDESNGGVMYWIGDEKVVQLANVCAEPEADFEESVESQCRVPDIWELTWIEYVKEIKKFREPNNWEKTWIDRARELKKIRENFESGNKL